jgi:hypothetical protein
VQTQRHSIQLRHTPPPPANACGQRAARPFGQVATSDTRLPVVNRFGTNCAEDLTPWGQDAVERMTESS